MKDNLLKSLLRALTHINISRAFLNIFFGIVVILSSCKKDNLPVEAKPIVLGLYEKKIDVINKRLLMHITKVGDVSIDNFSMFDTASSGMLIDADGLLPVNMFNENGISIPGDSLIYNGITITKQKVTLEYGNKGSYQTKAYGNLAYGKVMLGDNNGNITTNRMPFVIYYYSEDDNHFPLPHHELDIFGVAPGSSHGSKSVNSPLLYVQLPKGIFSGFKLNKLDGSRFISETPSYVPNLLEVGINLSMAASEGFKWHQLGYSKLYGYQDEISMNITFGGKTIASSTLLDTGTPGYTIIQDPNATTPSVVLANNTNVAFSTTSGFEYKYSIVDPRINATIVQNPSYSQDTRSIVSIYFFLNNSYLMDYSTYQLGLKN